MTDIDLIFMGYATIIYYISYIIGNRVITALQIKNETIDSMLRFIGILVVIPLCFFIIYFKVIR